MPIDGQVMFEIAPRFSGSKAARQAENVAEISPILASTLASYGIDTRLRIAHFLGQTCHVFAGFRTTEEFASGEAWEESERTLGNTKDWRRSPLQGARPAPTNRPSELPRPRKDFEGQS